ncbi:MAG: amino acid permease [Candidatus Melainabacteria bacterium]|nr:amino acid permease [Candidatus Melainabacteria bacterium]
MEKIFANLLRRKTLESIKAQGDTEHADGHRLNRVLTSRDILSAGVAAIIGTGIFVLIGAAAHANAGPGIIISFVLASLACGFVSFAYAEFASMIPVAGSAYTYAYATLGEIFAWIIGWDLLLEYAVGASTVASGWSDYFQSLLLGFGVTLPNHFATASSNSINLPAILIIVFLNYWLIKGVKHTVRMTSIFVIVKLAIVLFFIAVGAFHIDPGNYIPFLPFGWSGVLTGAGVVFFAFIGFDAVTTMAEECKDPQKDVPKGVIGSLVVCTILYLLVAAIMTGAMSYTALGGEGEGAPMVKVLNHIGYAWASPLISVGIVAGLTSVLIVTLFAQSRIIMRMSKDGLLTPIFSTLSHKYQTPTWSIVVCGIFVAVTAGLLPIDELSQLTSIGTLFAFIIVCVGVIVLRHKEPEQHRGFRCPGYPFVPVMGALMSFMLMCTMPSTTWIRFIGWMLLGLIVYFGYSKSHSRLGRS